ncbi:TPA: hypothetical protein DEB02_05465, partial [Candidatus Beckwithbacteria bacterium]|nr:hypothetical protein [Candidatus Beckwithbacteria bacterium]
AGPDPTVVVAVDPRSGFCRDRGGFLAGSFLTGLAGLAGAAAVEAVGGLVVAGGGGIGVGAPTLRSG